MILNGLHPLGGTNTILMGLPEVICRQVEEFLRDHKWQLKDAYDGLLRIHTVNQDEGMILLWGLNFPTSMGFTMIAIKGYSKIIFEAI